jgi:hypothetical protein
MSTMFGGGGGGASPASWALTGDILKKNQAEQDRLTAKATEVNALADVAGVSAKALGDAYENQRQAKLKNPNPWMTTGYTGVADFAGSRTLGSPYLLGT